MIVLALLLMAAQGAPLDAPAVPNSELATQRGGFTLPNGIDVSLTVQTQTAINGNVVLQTVFRADQGPPSFQVFTPRAGESVAASPSAAATNGGGPTAAPSISFDNRNGLHVTPGMSSPAISVSAGAARALAASERLVAVDASGAGVATEAGQVTQSARGGVQTAELRGMDITVSHFAGNAFGSAIANSGSDRAIDTQTSVSIDLSNVRPDALGSAMFRVQDIALDAAALRAQ